MSAAQAIQLGVSRSGAPSELRTFEAGEVSVGRSHHADVRILGGPISRRHLVFVHGARGWAARNGGRRVPTLHNGATLPPGAAVPVRGGDVFGVGPWRIDVRFAGGDALLAWIAAERARRGDASIVLRLDRHERPSEWLGFSGGPVVAGRSATADVVLEGYLVSRRHASLERSAGGWTVTHAGRMLPTAVNDRELPVGSPRPLADGDSVRVGAARLVVCLGDRLPALPWDSPHELDGSVTRAIPVAPDRTGAPDRTAAPDESEADAGDAGGAAWPSTYLETRHARRAPADDDDDDGAHTRRLWGEDDGDAATDEPPGTHEPRASREEETRDIEALRGDAATPGEEIPPTSSGRPAAASGDLPQTWWETRRAGAGEIPPTELAGPHDGRAPLREGALVDDRFRIVRRVPADRPAAAWSATDERSGAALVVYEVFHEEEDSADDRARLDEDLRRVAASAHAAVERVVEVLGSGPHVLVACEALPGRTLRDEMAQRAAARQPFSSEETARAGREMIAAFSFVGPRVVHGALSPDLVRVADDGAVRIAALGWRMLLARDLRRAPPSERRYAAPELAAGGEDWRADQYSVAAVLWEMVAGASPRASPPARSEMGAAGSGSWYAALSRALDAVPDRRFPSWDAFRAAIP